MAATGPFRVLVQAEEGAGAAAVDAAVAALDAADRWLVEPLFPDEPDGDLQVIVLDPAIPLAPTQMFDLAATVAARPGIARAEPDLPVTAYAPPGAEGGGTPVGAFAAAPPAPPTPDDLRWAGRGIDVEGAWALGARGQGIRIGHPDTGYTPHTLFGPGALDLTTDRDVIDDDDDARDPLRRSPVPLARFPGHGTGTGSVIVARGDGTSALRGIAPEATLVPLRAVNSVVQFLDSDVARAVDHARRHDCHIVSMSLGGKGFFGLRKAIDRCLDEGMIVMAAAGNHVRLITAPASYESCIAVAATGRDDTPWSGSSRGADIEVSAPGSGVFGAAWTLDGTPTEHTSTKAGTSYAVVHVAGVAALWLSHHGRDALLARYPGRMLSQAFRRIVARHGHRRPDGWDTSRWGVGIVDARATLAAPLPDPATLDGVGAFAAAPAPGAGPAPRTGAERIAAAFGELDAAAVTARLASAGIASEEVTDRVAAEVLYHLMTDDGAAAGFAADTGAGAFAPTWPQRLRDRGSATLNDAL
ncbi:MAG TPA: S8 family serine peptidase [Iamia sp.]|nr:S8 family serine peptidase [Iamia sp.]